MNIGMILEMAASAGDRPAVVADGRSLTAAELLDLAARPRTASSATRPSCTWHQPPPRPSSSAPSSPETVIFRPELPETETGKLLRRVLRAELETAFA